MYCRIRLQVLIISAAISMGVTSFHFLVFSASLTRTTTSITYKYVTFQMGKRRKVPGGETTSDKAQTFPTYLASVSLSEKLARESGVPATSAADTALMNALL